MSEPRCDCCDLPVSMCGKAVEQRQRAEAVKQRPPHGAETTARFDGRCAYGGHRISVGDKLRHDEEYGWCCTDCADTLDA